MLPPPFYQNRRPVVPVLLETATSSLTEPEATHVVSVDMVVPVEGGAMVAAEAHFTTESTLAAEAEVVRLDYAPDTKLVRDQIERLTGELLAAIAADPEYIRMIDAEVMKQRGDPRNHNLASFGLGADDFPFASEAENLKRLGPLVLELIHLRQPARLNLEHLYSNLSATQKRLVVITGFLGAITTLLLATEASLSALDHIVQTLTALVQHIEQLLHLLFG